MDNPVCQVFSTTMRDTTLCDLMGHESNHFFTDFFLEVPILKYYQTPDGVFAYPLENIYECLNEKFTVEDIEFRCSQCDEEEPQCKNECRGGKKIHKMSKPAKVLFIKLNRVDDMDPTTKIESSVEFPIMLDVSEYTVNDQTAKYQLNSIILHDSAVNSSEGGHYITVTRNDKNQYYYMDDSRKPRLINFETERESLYKQACFLSYVLVESGEVEEKQYSYIELAKNHLKKDKVDTVTNKNKLNKKKLNKKNLGQILRAKKRRPEDDDQSQTEKSVKKVFKN
ncbi:cysteine proteinase [Neoconidiobolus thromboides FSU 785]|nr:cysteine proteinase [Neoconidiobolus thromboides FSU 785]